MESLSRKLRVRVYFSGFVNQSQISHYYSMADAVVVISSYDPSPKVMNEAMNFSLPVIATSVWVQQKT